MIVLIKRRFLSGGGFCGSYTADYASDNFGVLRRTAGVPVPVVWFRWIGAEPAAPSCFVASVPVTAVAFRCRRMKRVEVFRSARSFNGTGCVMIVIVAGMRLKKMTANGFPFIFSISGCLRRFFISAQAA